MKIDFEAIFIFGCQGKVFGPKGQGFAPHFKKKNNYS